MYKGSTAIGKLVEHIHEEDREASSHWRKYHSKFEYFNGKFEGVDGFGGNSKSNILRRILHKQFQHKFRKLATNLPAFKKIDNSARKLLIKQNRSYDLDVLRQSLTLAYLKKIIPEKLNKSETACVIGDGFATMTTLILSNQLAKNVILVNLTKTLLIDLHYLKLYMGAKEFEDSVYLVTNLNELKETLSSLKYFKNEGKVIAIQAVHHKLLQNCPIDIALNIASMQEMDPQTISSYFDDLRAISSKRKLIFYCCNREEKQLPDGTVTRFSDYSWDLSDSIIFDELCPWHQEYYAFHPPFFRPYDGPIRHRLCAFS
ncbi:putative sugar O-methyltransferase [Bacteroidota bacterium]